ncbi:MAG: molybdopterin molybdotransferase MoeA [Candidatus Eremiobacteraeota bacterium]|nr:molybdopterin molybdotransferase MoeA [Candidatus Eremiobacteraeota bacterium]MBV8355440.1 molybdopterin molybdotransferase MoeA [Candidatus Eremiobacteraeota bacterium]
MQSVNPVLPARRFVPERLLSPHQAVAQFMAQQRVGSLETEAVALEDAHGRVLARRVLADADYPNASRSAMDGIAVLARATPGRFDVVGEVRMGDRASREIDARSTTRIPTGGTLPHGADAVVPVEDVRFDGETATVAQAVAQGENVVPVAADMQKGEALLHAGRRLRPSDVGLFATLGVTQVPVYRRPVIGVFSSGDELVEPSRIPHAGQIRDSNRYGISAALEVLGAEPRQYPILPDEPEAVERELRAALKECDAAVISGGSSVGARDRIPAVVERLGEPGIIVHGIRVKPGKPTLLGAHRGKPILGLPGNPTSALLMFQAVGAPIVSALVGAPFDVPALWGRLGAPARSRPGWTWYIPVRLEDDGARPLAHPLPLRSFSVSLIARADGFIVMEENDVQWRAGKTVRVCRFLGG